MAISDGFCTNCGSLMRIDPEQDEMTCIFCWDKVKTEEAIELYAQGVEGYAFPEKSFPEPSEEEKLEALKAQGFSTRQNITQTTKSPKVQERKRGRLTPQEKVALQEKPLVKAEASKKHKTILVGGIALVLAVLALISLPLYRARDDKKEALLEKIKAEETHIDSESKLDIRKQSNQELTVVLPEPISEEEALEVFNKYSAIYATVYEISETEAADKISVSLLNASDGGFHLKQEDEEVIIEKLTVAREEEDKS